MGVVRFPSIVVVCPTGLFGKNVSIGPYTQTLQPNSFIPTMPKVQMISAILYQSSSDFGKAKPGGFIFLCIFQLNPRIKCS